MKPVIWFWIGRFPILSVGSLFQSVVERRAGNGLAIVRRRFLERRAASLCVRNEGRFAQSLATSCEKFAAREGELAPKAKARYAASSWQGVAIIGRKRPFVARS